MQSCRQQQEPTEATQGRLNAAPERRRNLRPSGRGGCQLNSIDTGSAEANQEVAGKAWFDSKTYPTARFISKEVKAVGPQQYQVSGTLTIKGRSQPIVAAASLTPQGNQALIKGKFRFKRSDFAIGEGVWANFDTVANEIDVQFQFLAK